MRQTRDGACPKICSRPKRAACLHDVFLGAVIQHAHTHTPAAGDAKFSDAVRIEFRAQAQLGIEPQKRTLFLLTHTYHPVSVYPDRAAECGLHFGIPVNFLIQRMFCDKTDKLNKTAKGKFV